MIAIEIWRGWLQKRKLQSQRPSTIWKILTCILPHLLLTVGLFGYMIMGAVIFRYFETGQDIEKRRERLKRIKDMHSTIIDSSMTIDNDVELSRVLGILLTNLSSYHEYDGRFLDKDQMWTMNEADLETKWTFTSALLYALTVMTTCGFDHVTPVTRGGQISIVIFGLVGIPVMFITAADIGKFLSELLKYIYFWCRRRYQTPENEEEDENKIPGYLPILGYFAMVCLWCMLGSWMFGTYDWRMGIWNFRHGFFFSFATMTTMGLGSIFVKKVSSWIIISIYVIVGLAIITMSIDLASAQLKKAFRKLHYFGRKIKILDEIKEAKKILRKIRNNKKKGKGIDNLADLHKIIDSPPQDMKESRTRTISIGRKPRIEPEPKSTWENEVWVAPVTVRLNDGNDSLQVEESELAPRFMRTHRGSCNMAATDLEVFLEEPGE